MASNTEPALPRLPRGGMSLSASRSITSPINPSPLRENIVSGEHEAKIDDNGGVMLSTTPESISLRSGISERHAEVKIATVEDITPPDSKYTVQRPLVLDGSMPGEATLECEQRPTSPSDVIIPETPDDPFVTTPFRPGQPYRNPAGVPQGHISAIIQANLSHPRIATLEPPREDRLNQKVTVHNAQGLFPKEAKLFVANLSNLRTNDQLEISVAAVFVQFGACTIIIKRDRNHQPMGFVQYQLVQDAELAKENADGCTIDGRVVRIEWANARQELIVSSHDNQPLPEEEVRQALAGRGPIASVKPTGPPTSDGQTGTAWIVEFRYYADCKEAIRLMRENHTYRVVPAPKHQRLTPYPIAAPRTPQGAFYEDNDSRSIFLGRLPDSVAESELCELFAYFGTILSCNIISKPMTTGGMNTFAYMEFKYAEDAASAANTSQCLRGQKIRVERKQYAQRRAARVAAATGPVQALMNTPRTPHYLTPSFNNTIDVPSYHAATPYSNGRQGFTMADYNTTPPTPVYMVPYGQYASPAHPAPRMRQSYHQHGFNQMQQNLQYATGPSQDQGVYISSGANYNPMNAIAEEQEGCVFD